jgi:hypothetical protein
MTSQRDAEQNKIGKISIEITKKHKNSYKIISNRKQRKLIMNRLLVPANNYFGI